MSGEASSHEDVGAHRVEVFCIAPDPRGALIERRLTLYLDGFAPVVLLHRSVGGDANFLPPRNGVESFFDSSIEGFHLGGSVAGCLRIEVDDVPVRRVELEIDVPQLIQALDKHACSNQQHQSQSRLQHDEAALQQ